MSTGFWKLLFNLYVSRKEPFSLVHFITNRCNARCGHCFIDFKEPVAPENELTVPEIDLLTKTIGSSLYNVNITGGEPFIRNDIFEIVECYIRNTDVRSIVITTNGWFTDDIASFLEKYSKTETSCRIRFSISIDNFEQQHDMHRKVYGLYAKALESYRLLDVCNDQRVSVNAILTVTPSNRQNITAVFRSLQDAGVKEVFPVLLREEGTLKQIDEKDEVLKAYNTLVLLAQKTAFRPSSSFNEMMANAVLHAKNRIVSRILCSTFCSPRFVMPCTAGSLFGVIYSDGRVSPCEVLDSSWTLGNVRDHNMNFLAVWRSSTGNVYRKKICNEKCHCTYECAWTVNVISQPVYWPKLIYYLLRDILWNRTV